MPEPQATPHGPVPSQPASAPVHAQVQRPEGTRYQPFIRYYKKMRVGRTYRFSVSMPRVNDARPVARTASGSVRVRPVIPGAVVNPSEAAIDLTKADAQANFQVTCAAKGKLRGAAIQLYHQDRLVHEVPLSMRGSRQTLTWVLACLTVALPILLVPIFGQDAWLRSTGENRALALADQQKAFAQAHPFRGNANGAAPAGAGAAAQAAGLAAKGGAQPNALQAIIGALTGNQSSATGAKPPQQQATRGGQPPAGRRTGMPAGRGAMGGRGGRGGGRGGRGGPGLNAPAPGEQVVSAEKTPQEVKNEEEAKLHGTIERSVFHVLPTWIPPKEVSKPVAMRLQDGYDFIETYADPRGWPEAPFYLFVVLLVLTLGSWLLHAGYTGRRRVKPIVLGA